MQIKTFTLALLATLATASAVPKQQFARSNKNESSPVYGAGANTPSSSKVIAAPTGASIRYGTAPLGTAPLGTAPSGNALNGLNVSTTFVATVSSLKVATSTQTVQTTLLLTNGTKTIEIPTTMVVTKTNTVVVYFTQAPNGQQQPVSTANPVAASPSKSIMLSLSPSISNQVLTYTQGAGSSKTVVTTTIKKTLLVTLTKTVIATLQPSASGVTAQAAAASPAGTVGKTRTVTLTTTVFTGTPNGVKQAAGAATASPTGSSNEAVVTVHATRTITTTMQRPGSSSVAVAAVGNQGGQLAQSGSICALAVTSTVTLKSTVYVTGTKPSKSTKAATKSKPTYPMGTGTSGSRNGTVPALPAAANGTLANAGSRTNSTLPKNSSKPKATETKPAAVASGSTALLLSLATNTAAPVSTIVKGETVASAPVPTSSPYKRLARRVDLGENADALGF